MEGDRNSRDSESYFFLHLPMVYYLTGLNVSSESTVLWCSNVSFSNLKVYNGTIRLFPIQRIENYQSATSDYVSTQTKALMYTLGVLYSLIGFLYLPILVLFYFSNLNLSCMYCKFCKSKN
jgi:hypothetical protein